MPFGHPEGYYIAIANIYRSVIDTILKLKNGETRPRRIWTFRMWKPASTASSSSTLSLRARRTTQVGGDQLKEQNGPAGAGRPALSVQDRNRRKRQWQTCRRQSFTRGRQFAYEDRPIPEIKNRNDVKIKSYGCAVCGTDVNIFATPQKHPCKQDIIFGHEFCGEVAEVGEGVTDLSRAIRWSSTHTAPAASATTARPACPKPASTSAHAACLDGWRPDQLRRTAQAVLL